MTPVSLIGATAALCTTGAYIPQLVKTWRSRRAADISGHMFALLMLGTALWLAYGILKTDWGRSSSPTPSRWRWPAPSWPSSCGTAERLQLIPAPPHRGRVRA